MNNLRRETLNRDCIFRNDRICAAMSVEISRSSETGKCQLFQRRYHAWNIRTDHNPCDQSRRPDWCSANLCSMKLEFSRPLAAREGRESRSEAQPASGPRIQSPIGTAKPAFGRSTKAGGT